MRCAVPVLVLLVSACTPDVPLEAVPGTHVLMDLEAARSGGETFFDAPYPSDLRLEDGHPALSTIPNPNEVPLIAGFAGAAGDLRGYPVMPVAWFRFDGAVGERDPADVLRGTLDDPILLLDVDPESPRQGQLTPVVAHTLARDPVLPDHVLAVAPLPGVVLDPDTTYAFVIRRSLLDAGGEPLGVPLPLVALAHDELPGGPWDDAAELQAQTWLTLDALAVDRTEVAALAVFTTGDAVGDLYALSERVREAWTPAVADLALPERGLDHELYCELHGTLRVPEFQAGDPPFDTEGLFVGGDVDLPVLQREADMPVVITLPRGEMPAEGWPLTMYFHGSGGLSDQLVTRGPAPPDGEPALGYGPAHELARHGYAAAGSAHPLNPERVEGASWLAYLNFQNLPAFRDTFRQGVLEQRLYLDALLALEIDPSVAEGCEGLSLPAGASSHRFDDRGVAAMGQSMGGMYANLVSAVEPRILRVVPTGAGGFWSHFILVTELMGEGVPQALLSGAVGNDEPLTFLHPVMHVAQTAWMPAEPMASMPRLALDPLPGHPARDVYEPVGKDDSYFPPSLFDAMALAYGHPQAGEEVWPGMQAHLALVGGEGLLTYPVVDNVLSRNGETVTGAVVQYAGDGFSDPHAIFTQLGEVRHQYGCFLEGMLDGEPAVLERGQADAADCAGR